MRFNDVVPRIVIFSAMVLFAASQLPAAPMAMLSLEPAPLVSALGGETVAFDLWLRNYVPDNPSDAILSFGLNVKASDPALSDGGTTDYSDFNFLLDPGLNGILGGFPGSDFDISDGRVEIGADIPAESGILQSMGDVKLGSLEVVAPQTPGIFAVDFKTDASSPILGGTFLLIDDGSGLPTLPGDGILEINASAIAVIPEPATLLLVLFGSFSLGIRRLRYRVA